MIGGIRVVPVAGVGEVGEGDSVGILLAGAVSDGGAALRDDDVVVVSHKIVSKAEGRVRELGAVTPSGRAAELAHALGKDPRLVQLVIEESAEIIRAERGVLITETGGGWVCANAGIDASNVPGDDSVLLLPEDADVSARRIRRELAAASGVAPAVVVADSFGRAWRVGQVDVAIGCAGLAPLEDWRGRRDAEGRELTATVVAVADEVAAAADLVRDKDAGVPAAVVSGLGRHVSEEDGPGAAPLRRDRSADLFR